MAVCWSSAAPQHVTRLSERSAQLCSYLLCGLSVKTYLLCGLSVKTIMWFERQNIVFAAPQHVTRLSDRSAQLCSYLWFRGGLVLEAHRLLYHSA